MLDHKSEFSLQEIEDPPKKIEVHVTDDPRNEVVVFLPGAAELAGRDEDNLPEVKSGSVPTSNFFNMPDFFREELERLSAKYSRFHSSYTYLNHLAQLSYLSDDLNGAETYLRAAIESNPRSDLLLDLGALFIEQNRDSEARSAFLKCDLSKDVGANLRLAQLHVRLGQLQDAEVYVNKALLIDDTDYAAQMFAGAIHLWKRDWEQAVRSFRNAAEIKSNSTTLFSNLAVAYWGLGEHEKSIRELRRAINLDPLNENAVLFFTDVMFLRGMPEKCIHPLEVILSHKQENETLWSRIARAYYEVGSRDSADSAVLEKALDALTIQTKLKNSSSTVNNIGVVQSALGNPYKAKRYFARAWAVAQELAEDEDIPFSNFLSTLIELKEYNEAMRLTGEHIQTRGHNALSRVYVHRVVCMEALGKRSQAVQEAETFVQSSLADSQASLELLTHLFYYKTLVEPDRETLMRFIPRIEEILDSNYSIPDKLRCRVINNLVFALLTFQAYDHATRHLGKLSRWVHDDPFATATLGLYNLRKGKIKRAEALYRESIVLANNSITKERIRQRMSIEFGKYFLGLGDKKQANKYLGRALKQKSGFNYAKAEARKLLSKTQST